MYYITNGKVCWHIENQIGEWLEQGVFCLSHEGWKLHGMDSNEMVNKLREIGINIITVIVLLEIVFVLLPIALWQARKQQCVDY